jgi:hypothetical protein
MKYSAVDGYYNFIQNLISSSHSNSRPVRMEFEVYEAVLEQVSIDSITLAFDTNVPYSFTYQRRYTNLLNNSDFKHNIYRSKSETTLLVSFIETSRFRCLRK